MISLIGMGSGCPESLTAQGLAALQGAGLILGAKRLLEHLPAGCTDNCKAVYKPEEILACLAAQPDTDTAILYSGDTGFYSGAAKLLPLLRTMGYSVRVLPGLSSVQLLAAAVGRPWQDWKLVSAHGRVCDPVTEVLSHPQVFFSYRRRGLPCHSLLEVDRRRAGRCSRPCGRKPRHSGGSHPLWPCPGAGSAELCTAECIAYRAGSPAAPPHARPAGRCFYPGCCAHDKAGGARRRAGKAGGDSNGQPMGRGRGHWQCERRIGACRPCRAGICRRV